jgi:hypothetical protein
MKPFAAGNDSVAFAGLMAFLEANGRSLNVEDASGVAWFHSVVAYRDLAEESIRERWSEGHEIHGLPDLQSICDEVIERFPRTLAALAIAATPAR